MGLRYHNIPLLKCWTALFLICYCFCSGVLARDRKGDGMQMGGMGGAGGGGGGGGIEGWEHGDGPDQKLRHRQRNKKGGAGKSKKNKGHPHLSQEVGTTPGTYGTNLPAFAFDYSEYLAGAVIERSAYSDNLYLTMFFVGHRSVAHDWPFDMISTDEEVMYTWGKTARNWNTTSHQANHRDATDTGTGTAADGHRSGIVCIMQSEGMHKTYTAPAHWIAHTDSTTDSSQYPITGTFEILRCPIRGNNRVIYDTLSRGAEALLVDLVRLKERNRDGVGTGADTGAGAGGGGGGGRKHRLRGSTKEDIDILRRLTRRKLANNNNDDRFDAVQQSQDQAHADTITSHRNVLISFSIPWKSRQTGYGANFHLHTAAGTGKYDVWQEIAMPFSKSVHMMSKSQSKGKGMGMGMGIVQGGNLVAGASGSASAALIGDSTGTDRDRDTGTKLGSGLVLCVPGIRPLHPHRAEVGLPMLLEFVEHHTQLGVDHIFLGIALDWHSPLMNKYYILFQEYINSGKVSISSMALTGYDDAMGFAGIKLNEKYAELFFINQCLYLSKGISDYMIIMKPSQFLHMPVKMHLSEVVASIEAATTTTGPMCSTPLNMYYIVDPQGTFGGWGPADSVFSYEFFKKSNIYGPLSESTQIPSMDRLAHHMLSTKLTWLSTGRTSVVCGAGHSYIPSYMNSPHARKHGYSSSNSKFDASTTATMAKNNVNGNSNTVGTSVLSIYHFVEKLPLISSGSELSLINSHLSSSSGSTGAAAGTDTGTGVGIMDVMTQVWTRLRDKSMGSVAAINEYLKSKTGSVTVVVIQDRDKDEDRDKGKGKGKGKGSNININKDSDRNTVIPKLASSMIAPFWLTTDTEHLFDILIKVFPQG